MVQPILRIWPVFDGSTSALAMMHFSAEGSIVAYGVGGVVSAETFIYELLATW